MCNTCGSKSWFAAGCKACEECFVEEGGAIRFNGWSPIGCLRVTEERRYAEVSVRRV